MNMSLHQQDQIRNAILSYKGLRRRMFRNMVTQVELISEIDKQILRIQKVAGNGELAPLKPPWYKRVLVVISLAGLLGRLRRS